MKYLAPTGVHDILPDETPAWRAVEQAFRDVCDRYGYQEIRTPVFEQTDLFKRTSGETSDIVTKQMYTFEDPGGDSLTLRPEGTASVVRAYVEHSLANRSPLQKLCYICPVFRYERPQKGRVRQHHQVGIEALGSVDASIDAEIIALGRDYLRAVGIAGEMLHLNSVGCPNCRPQYREKLRDFLRPLLPELCSDCQGRFGKNPLRVLDCKVERCIELSAGAPGPVDALCPECEEHFGNVRRFLDIYGVGYEVNQRLVRGLDYYTKTAFEFMHDALGAQSTVIGGGRYDGLVEECGGAPTPGIGFGSGIERVLLIRQALGIDVPAPRRPDLFIAALGEAARPRALELLRQARDAGLAADTDYLGRSLKSQMKHADRLQARFTLILGEDEIDKGVATVRDMASSVQEEVALNDIVNVLARRVRAEA